MWKIVLAFAAGAAAGWLARPVAAPQTAAVVATASPVAKAHVEPARASSRRARDFEKMELAVQSTGAVQANEEAANSDSEVLEALKSEDAMRRALATRAAGERGLLTFEQLLARVRNDPVFEVRWTALTVAVELAVGDDSRLDAVSREVLAWARDPDRFKRNLALEQLPAIGARGATFGRELLDQGGLSPAVYGAAASALIAARRFDHLVPDGSDGATLDYLFEALQKALDKDASIASRVADVLREAGPSIPGESVRAYCSLAIAAHAAQVVRELAQSRTATVVDRSCALLELLRAPEEAGSAVTIAGEILADRTTPATTRRALLEELGAELGERGEAGLSVLRRVADHDESPWIRELGADLLRDAGDR